ncbi:MAG TPA: DinB family protein [Candidatus Angelobacter sp.]|nr:DinB family protein [Candidatus Angelobacter sp.]
MNTECLRIADQLRRSYEGKAWHGPSLREILSGITAEQAKTHSIQGAHSIWELVLHIEAWQLAALNATKGTPMPSSDFEGDWPKIGDGSPNSWQKALERFFVTNEALASAVSQFGDARLTEIVPGRKYDFYFLFHGIVQHGLYHGGQIVLVKKSAQP